LQTKKTLILLLPLNSFISLLSSFSLFHPHLPSIIYFPSLAAGARGLALLMIDSSGFSALHRPSFYSVVFISYWLAALDVLAAHQLPTRAADAGANA
jgi:hypothetical protein